MIRITIKKNPTSFINSDLCSSNIYNIGRYIVDTKILKVRSNPFISSQNDNWLKFEELSANAQKQIKELVTDSDVPNGLVKGVICDVSEVSENWGKIPSGWICLDYCKEIY